MTFLCASSAFATAQAPDRIIYNGQEYSLHTNPMEEYFAKYPEKKPTSEVRSSGLWRGYIATFEVADNSLFLKDIGVLVSKKTESGGFDTEMKSVIADLVPAGKKLKIDWFTGLLVLPSGKIVNYVHMGYGSTFEKYTLIEIDKGEFKKAKDFDYQAYDKFKERQFEAFKKTPEYKKMVDDMKKDGDRDQKFIDSFLKGFVTDYTTKILVD
jgi:hypothetical protein